MASDSLAGVVLADNLLKGLPNIPRHIQNLVLEVAKSKVTEIDFEKEIRSLEEHTDAQIAEETKKFLHELNGQLEEHIAIYNGVIKELLQVIHKKKEKCDTLQSYNQLTKTNHELKHNLKGEEDALKRELSDDKNVLIYVKTLRDYAIKNAAIYNSFVNLKLPEYSSPPPHSAEKYAKLEALKKSLNEERLEYDRLQKEMLKISEQNEHFARVLSCKERSLKLDDRITVNFNSNSDIIENNKLSTEVEVTDKKNEDNKDLISFCREEEGKLRTSIAQWEKFTKNENYAFHPVQFNNLVAMEAEKFNRILNPNERGKKRRRSNSL